MKVGRVNQNYSRLKKGRRGKGMNPNGLKKRNGGRGGGGGGGKIWGGVDKNIIK